MTPSDVFSYATGAVLMAGYMVMGIGCTRIISAAKRRAGIRLFEVFFWPVALSVIAYAGDMED